jgi:hypothetical protein
MLTSKRLGVVEVYQASALGTSWKLGVIWSLSQIAEVFRQFCDLSRDLPSADLADRQANLNFAQRIPTGPGRWMGVRTWIRGACYGDRSQRSQDPLRR